MRKLQSLALKLFNKVVTDERGNKICEREYFDKYFPVYIKGYKTFSPDSLLITVNVINVQKSVNTRKTFFQTWEEVERMEKIDIEFEQLKHYLSTYGSNFSDKQYIPNKKFNEFTKNFISIESMTMDEFLSELVSLVKTPVAFKSEEIEVIARVLKDNIDIILINEIKNKELKLKLYEIFDTFPDDAQEFLNYFIYKCTGETLIVKNSLLISYVKDNAGIYKKLFKAYIAKNGFIPLAEIFNRNKKIFLAIKHSFYEKQEKALINKISKISKKSHVPKVQPDYLRVTSGELSLDEFMIIISKMDISYLVKLYNSLNYRLISLLEESNIFVYHIRNGKSFTKQSKINLSFSELETYVLILKRNIEIKIQRNIDLHKIKIDNTIDYAIPTSGKQFVGDIPYGSKIYYPKNNLVCGIYWKGPNSDLDLSLTDTSSKIGWNSGFSNSSATYSGDVTDGTDGACELMRIKNIVTPYVVNVNAYHISTLSEFKFFIGEDCSINKNIMLKENDIIKMTDVNENVENGDHFSLGVLFKDNFMFGQIQFPSSAVSGVTSKDLLKAIEIENTSKLTFSQLDLIFPDIKEETTKSNFLKLVA
jgi:hypothetical protein